MTETQKKQYITFIAAFVQLLFEDSVSRETATEMGLSALSAFVGAICDVPKDDEQLTQYGGYCAGALKQSIVHFYGE